MHVDTKVSNRAIWCLSALAGLALVACPSPQVNHELLQESVDDFSRQLRWGDAQQTAAYLPAKAAETLATQEDDDIRITAAVVRNVSHPDEKTAKVILLVEWYRQSRGTVQSTTALQTWRWKAKRWTITAQRWLKGPPLPLLPSIDEPAPPTKPKS